MLEAEQLQQGLQVRQVQLALYLMGASWHDVAVRDQVQRGAGCRQILREVGLLLGQREAKPLGEDLVMAVAEGAVGDLAADNLAQRRMHIVTGERVAQGRKKDKATEVGWNSRKCFSPQFRGWSSRRFRFCGKIRQTPP